MRSTTCSPVHLRLARLTPLVLLTLTTACGGQAAPTAAPPAAAVPTPAVQPTPVPVVSQSTPTTARAQPGVPAPSSATNPIPGLVPANEGKLGWSGLAFVGGGEANKLWIMDAREHKLVDMIDVGGPPVERTDPRRYPNLRDAHAITFSKDAHLQVRAGTTSLCHPTTTICMSATSTTPRSR